MKLAAVCLAVLALAAPAAAAPPREGLVVPGTSLGGVRLGAPITDVLRRWGRSFGICDNCTQTTWYWNYVPFQPQGTGAEFRNGRVHALFTLWSPPGWWTERGVKVGDAVEQVTAIFGALDRVDCTGYYALLLQAKGTVTAFYVVNDRVWGFGLSRGREPCR